jgi:membrane protein required for colicin V production
MVTVDYLFIAIVVLSAVVGAVRGLLREVIALVTWVIALWGAWTFSGVVEPYLGGVLEGSPARPWAARAVVFIGLLLLGAAVGALVGYFVRLSIFSGADRFLGFVFGLARGVVAVGVIVLVVQQLRIDRDPNWQSSRLLPYAQEVASALRSLVGEQWRPEEAPRAGDKTSVST